MKKYAYVRCEVSKPDPSMIGFFAGLSEKVTGQPVPDVVPPVHPSSMSFRHATFEAWSSDEAYNEGPKHLPPVNSDTICLNDYVIEL